MNAALPFSFTQYIIIMIQTYYDSPKENRFIGSVLAGNTVKNAGKQFDISQTTASNIWHKYQQTGSTHSCLQTGCPPKITPHTTHNIMHEARKNHCTNLSKIGQIVMPKIPTSSIQKNPCRAPLLESTQCHLSHKSQ